MHDKDTREAMMQDAEAIATVISDSPHNTKELLCTITKAVILGAQIAEQCQAMTAKDAS